MSRLFLIVSCILAATGPLLAQAPGIDPRGLAVHSTPVIIGVVEGSPRTVIRPDKLPKQEQSKRQPDGTFIVELPRGTLEHMVGYIFRVRVREVLKSDRRVRAGQTVDVFAPFRLEGAVYLPTRQGLLLTLAAFSPKKEDFDKTSVLKFGQSTSQPGESFDLDGHYYVVAGDANGVVSITEKNQKLIQEIRRSIRTR